MKILSDDIARHDWYTLGSARFRDEYVLPLRPAILTRALDHWPALGKWTPAFFRDNYGTRKVTVDGHDWPLGELIDRIETSSPAQPAPYLRNEWLARWPKQLTADIKPMPACTQPNWLESWAFPARDPLTFIELYIGGAGAKFPVLHFDNLHTHAFLMQLYGEKEYLALAPDQGQFLYPRDGTAANQSSIDDLENVDPKRFPLFERAEAIRFQLHPGETLFVPAGWWHTARIMSTSITVSINGANAPNWQAFKRDYCALLAKHSRLQAALVLPYLDLLGEALALIGRL